MSDMKSISVAVIAATLMSGIMVTGSSAVAQSLRQAQVPAEFPPASYKGTQYVDSRGCAYIRAGVDGVTTWVPRVSRKRRPVCGQTPTQVAGATNSAPLAQGVEQITLTTPPPQAPTPEPVAARAPKPVAQVTATPVPRPLAPRAARPTPAPAIIATAPRAAAPTPDTAPKPRAVTPSAQSVPQCQGASPLSTRYINRGRDNLTVRCAPQSEPHSTPFARRPAATSGARSASVRVLPAHVAEARGDIPTFEAPQGYRPAWSDDRLNPRRTEGTLNGWRSMQLVWTNEVPRRLVDRTSGQDMTAKAPLVYPFTDTPTQEREFGKVTLSTMGGKVIKRVKRNPGAPRLAALAAGTNTPNATRVASPNAESLAGKHYVQVATFGVAANAQATAARLKRAGLPIRIGKLTRGGKTYRLVLAGPFTDNSSAEQALRAARNAGFGDAYIRN